MFSILFGFQIFIVILLALIIVFQKSSSDGIVASNATSSNSMNSASSIISKFTILLIFLLMANSLVLAKKTVHKQGLATGIIKSLEGDSMIKKESNDKNDIPDME
jgi:preprotein translocase subunit SecG